MTAAIFTSLDEASQKEYLLHSSKRSTMIAEQDAAVCTLAGAAAALADWPTRRSFTVLHYRLTQDGSLLPCLSDIPSVATSLTPNTASDAPTLTIENVTRCRPAEDIHKACNVLHGQPAPLNDMCKMSFKTCFLYTVWSRAAQRSYVSAVKRASAAHTQRSVQLAS